MSPNLAEMPPRYLRTPAASRFVGPAEEIAERIGDWLESSPPGGEVPPGLRSKPRGGGA